jgi:hypothetical protein
VVGDEDVDRTERGLDLRDQAIGCVGVGEVGLEA